MAAQLAAAQSLEGPVNELQAMVGVQALLRLAGEDADREGLQDTPGRVLRAFLEMTAGYQDDPAQILATRFDAPYDEMVILRGIDFVSLCEHHLLPFTGTAAVAYIPTDRVVGLSKLARLVLCYARRLQLQERLTRQVAVAIEEHLKPLGVGVIVQASHQCMGCRGVRLPGATMVTSALLGEMRRAEVRAEFLQLAHAPERT